MAAFALLALAVWGAPGLTGVAISASVIVLAVLRPEWSGQVE